MSAKSSGPLVALIADLAAEQDSVDSIVAPLTSTQWAASTPAAGWDIRDQIAHLAFVDELATQTLVRPEAFARTLETASADQFAFEAAAAGRGRQLTGGQVLAWWRQARREGLAAFGQADPDSRLPWFGPPMKLRSFVTARLMETWAHGQDVAATLGVPLEPTGRLAHIAHLGVVTRGWSFAGHGQEPPVTDVYVELLLPSGHCQQWGPPDAADQVRGTALEFCLVVTQRRHWADTALQVTGSGARSWLEIAQAFAGPPTVTQAGRGLAQAGATAAERRNQAGSGPGQ